MLPVRDPERLARDGGHVGGAALRGRRPGRAGRPLDAGRRQRHRRRRFHRDIRLQAEEVAQGQAAPLLPQVVCYQLLRLFCCTGSMSDLRA